MGAAGVDVSDGVGVADGVGVCERLGEGVLPGFAVDDLEAEGVGVGVGVGVDCGMVRWRMHSAAFSRRVASVERAASSESAGIVSRTRSW